MYLVCKDCPVLFEYNWFRLFHQFDNFVNPSQEEINRVIKEKQQKEVQIENNKYEDELY